MAQSATTESTDDETTADADASASDSAEAFRERLTDAAEAASDLSDADLTGEDTEALADLLATLKTVENAVEDARKDAVEDVLDERVDVGESAGPVTRVEGHRKYVTADLETVLWALGEAGADPNDVLNVKASALAETAERVGMEKEVLIGRRTYTYYSR